MKLSPVRCPKCKGEIHSAVDLTPAEALLSRGPHGDFDYAGESLINWDGQENVLDVALRIFGEVVNVNEYMLVQCVDRHVWIARVKQQGKEKKA